MEKLVYLEKLECLSERFKVMMQDAPGFHDSLMEKILDTDRKIIYTKGKFYSLKPFESQIYGFKNARPLKNRPSNMKNVYLNHFDDKNNLLLIEQINDDNSKCFNREFFVRSSNIVESVYFYFAGSARIRNMSHFYYENNLIRELYNQGVSGNSCWTFFYENKLLDRILISERENLKSDFSERVLSFKYNKNDLTEINSLSSSGYKEVLFPTKQPV